MAALDTVSNAESQRENEQALFCNDVRSFLLIGRDMYLEMRRNIFPAEGTYAEVLCSRCNTFMDGLSIISRSSVWTPEIVSDMWDLLTELERLYNIVNERVEISTPENSRYMCDYEVELDGQGLTRGRPRFLIPERQLTSLRKLNFTWREISQIVGVSEKTIRRRRAECSSPECENNFSDITNDELDNSVRRFLTSSPNSGERMVSGSLVAQGIKVQRSRLRASINRVDPVSRQLRRHTSIHRRVYNVPTPNALWHLDGNHKLIRWRVVVHGCIDGYSRAVVFLKCSNNNEAATVLNHFQNSTNIFHYPRRVRTDYGTENIEVARLMLYKYGVDSNPVITGRSIHNQRIERLWKDVFEYVLQYFYNLFYYMESQDLLDPNNEVHALALQFTYMPRINRALDYFSSQWNNHPMSTEGNRSPLQIWTSGFYQFAESDYRAVRDVLDFETTNFNLYGIDDEGPSPHIETSNHVVVPRSSIELSEDELDLLKNEIQPLDEDNNHGINFYQRAIMFINELLDEEEYI